MTFLVRFHPCLRIFALLLAFCLRSPRYRSDGVAVYRNELPASQRHGTTTLTHPLSHERAFRPNIPSCLVDPFLACFKQFFGRCLIYDGLARQLYCRDTILHSLPCQDGYLSLSQSLPRSLPAAHNFIKAAFTCPQLPVSSLLRVKLSSWMCYSRLALQLS